MRQLLGNAMKRIHWTVVVVGASLCVALAIGGAPAAADEIDVDRRIEVLERQLEELKKEVADQSGEASGEAPPAAPPEKSAKEMSLPTWHVTDHITFKPGIRIQPRYTYDSLATTGKKNRFSIRRFRLKAGGKIYDVAKYYTELKIGGTGLIDLPGTPIAAVENAWVEFTTLPYTNLRVGLYDIPFSRDALTSDSKLLLQDRSLIKQALTTVGLSDNTLGGLFHQRLGEGGRFEYATGIFQNRVFREIPTWSGRFALNLLDPAKPGGYGDYRGSYIGEGRRLAIGVNGAYTPNGQSFNSDFEFDLYAVGGDVFFNTGPFTLQGEYDWFKQDSNTTGTSDTKTHGGYVQTGVLLDAAIDHISTASWIPPIELAGRYQYIDSGNAFLNMDEVQALSIGMNFYIRSHNLKVQTDYTHLYRDVERDSDLYRLQLQLDF
jgi:phosphate-selective porin